MSNASPLSGLFSGYPMRASPHRAPPPRTHRDSELPARADDAFLRTGTLSVLVADDFRTKEPSSTTSSGRTTAKSSAFGSRSPRRAPDGRSDRRPRAPPPGLRRGRGRAARRQRFHARPRAHGPQRLDGRSKARARHPPELHERRLVHRDDRHEHPEPVLRDRLERRALLRRGVVRPRHDDGGRRPRHGHGREAHDVRHGHDPDAGERAGARRRIQPRELQLPRLGLPVDRRLRLERPRVRRRRRLVDQRRADGVVGPPRRGPTSWATTSASCTRTRATAGPRRSRPRAARAASTATASTSWGTRAPDTSTRSSRTRSGGCRPAACAYTTEAPRRTRSARSRRPASPRTPCGSRRRCPPARTGSSGETVPASTPESRPRSRTADSSDSRRAPSAGPTSST